MGRAAWTLGGVCVQNPQTGLGTELVHHQPMERRLLLLSVVSC